MAAKDAFESSINTFSATTKEKLHDFINEQRAEMFAARSEDERSRIADNFVRDVHDRLKKSKSIT